MPRPHLVVILACALSPVFVACAEIMGDGVQDSGDVELAITRSTASQVPPEADSAVIRIAHPTAGTNLIRRVAIPNLGDTTRVSIRAPARSGYTIAVAAYAGYNGTTRANRWWLVGGNAQDVAITSDAPARVHIPLQRWGMRVWVPDSIVPGEPTTFSGRITGAPSYFGGGFLCMSLARWTTTETLGRPCASPKPPVTMLGDSFQATFNALAADADTTAWYAIDFWVDTQPWQTGGLDYALLPALILGDTLRHVPVRVSGEIIVTFTPKR